MISWVDALEVGAGGGQVCVLVLDQGQRDAFLEQLDRVSMPELVGRQTPTHPRLEREMSKLDADRAG